MSRTEKLPWKDPLISARKSLKMLKSDSYRLLQFVQKATAGNRNS